MIRVYFGFKARMEGEKKYEDRQVPFGTDVKGLVKICQGQLDDYDLYVSRKPNGKEHKMKLNETISCGIYITARKRKKKK